MSSKGGYQILDLKDKTLTSGTAATIKGSFDALDRAAQKRIVISGMKVSTTKYSDVDAYFIPSINISTGKATGYNGALTIGSDAVAVNVAANDQVTVTVTPGNRAATTTTKKGAK